MKCNYCRCQSRTTRDGQPVCWECAATVVLFGTTCLECMEPREAPKPAQARDEVEAQGQERLL